MKNTWLIFGCGTSIEKAKKHLPFLLNGSYSTIGLNLFPVHYKNCEYWMVNDPGIITNAVKKNYSGEKLIINEKIAEEITKDKKFIEFRPGQHIIKETVTKDRYKYRIYTETNKPVLTKNGKLMFLHSVVVPAINFAFLKGAEQIILIGIDLQEEWRHFYDCNGGNNYKKPKEHIKIIQNCIYNFAKLVKIYKANSNANLNLEYKNLEELY